MNPSERVNAVERVSPSELLGCWQLCRRLADRRSATIGRVTGTLTIEGAGEAIRWREDGQLQWAGHQVEVTRSYELRQSNGEWWMHFADGRPFHPWSPGRWVVHECAEDRYTGLVEVSDTRIRTVWDVTGPAKSQRIITRFRRSG